MPSAPERLCRGLTSPLQVVARSGARLAALTQGRRRRSGSRSAGRTDPLETRRSICARKIAVGRGNEPDIVRPGRFAPPTGWISPFFGKPSSTACIRRLISPSSSRNSVPPLAWRLRPGLSRYAPVKLPRTWPNKFDSSSVSGMPLQLTATNGRVGRALWAWIDAQPLLCPPRSRRESSLSHRCERPSQSALVRLLSPHCCQEERFRMCAW